MKILFIFLITITAVCSAPTDKNTIILKYENTGDGLGSYHFKYETSDGTFREENGVLRNAEDPEKAYVAVNGRYSYIGPDGKSYVVTYTADEDGFQANGDHIPKAKPDGKFPSIPGGIGLPPSPTQLPILPYKMYQPKVTFISPEVARSLLGLV